MAAIGEIPGLSIPSIDGVVKIAQHLPVVGKRLGGSGLLDFIKLEWTSLPDVDPDSIAWAEEVPGDPKASHIPRWCHNVTVIGVEQQEIGELDAHEPDNGRWAKDTIVCLSEGEVKIGVNPESDHLFGGELIDGKRMFTLAKRLGRDPLRAALGQYRPDQERLYVPTTAAQVVDPLISDRRLHGPSGNYQNTQLAG
jgi:hypothetical protein